MSGSINDIVAFIQEWEDRVIEGAKSVVRDGGDTGAQSVAETINLTTSAWGEQRQAEGRTSAGRIETGQMLRAVDSEVITDAKYEYEVAWGWSDPALYFSVQEHGDLEHDTTIEGMHSLATSRDLVEDQVVGALKRLK